ncbi:hypothetical protein [Flavobacterium sp. 102]|uniref:hypothetical protein n=1 Tax=Flavobacterium sp. 102 TaxID=2135623 RepID=UPI000EAE58DA|nr:hypothetical protein [Flavobacterium sp. 102]RKS00427.1 hypothetical protein C8C84_0035 [Flavobacterium sp. 102]
MDSNPTIEIINNRIFIEGKETIDPVLIGYAVLDAVENSTASQSKTMMLGELISQEIKAKYFSMVDRKTMERELILDFVLKTKSFETIKKLKNGFDLVHKIRINHGTFYNTVNDLIEKGVLIKQPQVFEVNTII